MVSTKTNRVKRNLSSTKNTIKYLDPAEIDKKNTQKIARKIIKAALSIGGISLAIKIISLLAFPNVKVQKKKEYVDAPIKDQAIFKK